MRVPVFRVHPHQPHAEQDGQTGSVLQGVQKGHLVAAQGVFPEALEYPHENRELGNEQVDVSKLEVSDGNI